MLVRQDLLKNVQGVVWPKESRLRRGHTDNQAAFHRESTGKVYDDDAHLKRHTVFCDGRLLRLNALMNAL